MSLTIWPELDIPQSPINDYERDIIVVAATIGKNSISRRDFGSRKLVLIEQLAQTEIHDPETSSATHFIGRVIGVRAGLFDLNVATPYDNGFHITGLGLGHLRDAKISGTHAVEATPGASFADIMANHIITSRPPLFVDEDVIGYAIGVRHAQFEGAEV